MGYGSIGAFVSRYFEVPPSVVHTEANPAQPRPAGGLIRHIRSLWSSLSRSGDPCATASSLIPLPYPYLVPGGMFREVYYWDAYFTALGPHEERPDIVEGLVGNFAYLLQRFGRIPNGNRTYFL